MKSAIRKAHNEAAAFLAPRLGHDLARDRTAQVMTAIATEGADVLINHGASLSELFRQVLVTVRRPPHDLDLRRP